MGIQYNNNNNNNMGSKVTDKFTKEKNIPKRSQAYNNRNADIAVKRSEGQAIEKGLKHAAQHDDEQTLRDFDLDTKYGPCVGVTRLERWERAQTLGLNPPGDIRKLLLHTAAKKDSLWEGRV